jgi:hypothetical protein
VGAGDGFKFFGDAAVKLVHAPALAADDVVVVPGVARVCEAIQALSAFEWVALDYAGFKKGEDAAIDSDKVGNAGRKCVVEFFDGDWGVCGGEGIEHGFAWLGDAQADFAQVGEGIGGVGVSVRGGGGVGRMVAHGGK